MRGLNTNLPHRMRLDPAAATLNAILADGDQGELLVTLRQMAKAVGGVPAVAKASGLNAMS